MDFPTMSSSPLCVSLQLPAIKPSLHNVKLHRSYIGCISSYMDYSVPFWSFLLTRKKKTKKKEKKKKRVSVGNIWLYTTISCCWSSLLDPKTQPVFHSQHGFPGQDAQGEAWEDARVACDCLGFPSPTGKEKTLVARDVNQVLYLQ